MSSASHDRFTDDTSLSFRAISCSMVRVMSTRSVPVAAALVSHVRHPEESAYGSLDVFRIGVVATPYITYIVRAYKGRLWICYAMSDLFLIAEMCIQYGLL